jgi:predicted Zn-dependent protease
LRRIEQEWPLRGSADPLTRHVQTLVMRLGEHVTQGSTLAWHVHVVRNHAPNAFAIGNGDIFVTDGAFSFARTEAELAAILGHEMGHQLAGHFCQGASREDTSVFKWIDDLFGGAHAPSSHVHRQGIGSLTQHIDPAKEIVADKWAASLLSKAGYVPHAMQDVIYRLPKQGDSAIARDRQRVAALEQYIARYSSVSPENPRPDSREFQQLKRLVEADQ